jgi:hypothetical protein
MVKVTFTDNLQRHVELQPISVEPNNLMSVLDSVFQHFPKLRPYILDDQEQLRTHVMLVVDGNVVQSNIRSIQDVQRSLHIMQALSGG